MVMRPRSLYFLYYYSIGQGRTIHANKHQYICMYHYIARSYRTATGRILRLVPHNPQLEFRIHSTNDQLEYMNHL